MLFLAIITAPSIITIIDDTADVSVFYSLSEEEEENACFKMVITKTTEDNNSFFNTLQSANLGYYYKTYPKPHLNFTAPPPDFI
ncbi:MAG: hypothetical protein BM549_12415 [Lacinutrix sp. MedPE-SW]|nr:MAG: hypothetical protein BM549_12415 [Lacinutrix sp. MedPE-SW]